MRLTIQYRVSILYSLIENGVLTNHNARTMRFILPKSIQVVFVYPCVYFIYTRTYLCKRRQLTLFIQY